jgi:hypothetical protein
MPPRRTIAVLVTAALAVAAAPTLTSPAHADSRAARASTAHVLSTVGRNADVVTTDQGISVAMWSATADRTRLEWAVKRPGEPWSGPRVKGDWPGSPSTRGTPQLTTSSDHRVTAVWLDGLRRIVAENWSPTHGWSKPVHLSNRRHTAWSPRIVSNDAGMVAVGWSQQEVGFKNPSFATVAVRRHGSWSVKQIGPRQYGGAPGNIELGIAADGAVTAAWENVHQGWHPTFLARRLPAGTDAWEARNVFGTLDSEFFNADPVRLVVQPDGSELLSRPVGGSSDLQVFSRVGDGEWIDRGNQPFGGFSGGAVSLPSGSLVTWGSWGLAEDPDGIAGPASFAPMALPDFHTGTKQVQYLLSPDGMLVAVARKMKRVEYAVRQEGGDWSEMQTAYETTRNITQGWSSAISPDGHVTALLGTRPAGSSRHHPLRMEAIRFDATPETGVAR